MLLRVEVQIDAKYSNFESAIKTKSMSMPL